MTTFEAIPVHVSNTNECISDPKTKTVNMWSVYKRKDNLVEAIADFYGDNMKENAIKFAKILSN